MTGALRHLAESDEMRPFVAEARRERRNVVVEVFHSATGIRCSSTLPPLPGVKPKGVANAGTGTVLAVRGQAERL